MVFIMQPRAAPGYRRASNLSDKFVDWLIPLPTESLEAVESLTRLAPRSVLPPEPVNCGHKCA